MKITQPVYQYGVQARDVENRVWWIMDSFAMSTEIHSAKHYRGDVGYHAALRMADKLNKYDTTNELGLTIKGYNGLKWHVRQI
jgi:hypothetical protein